MKIISWNVNGLRATWPHGLADLLYSRKADIYAFQETKVNEPFLPAELDGYCAYWSYCNHKKGYSGTMVLSRAKPLRVLYDMSLPWSEDNFNKSTRENSAKPPTVQHNPAGVASNAPFDYEGRIITLEFREFWFVTVYCPNPMASSLRRDYRHRWDDLLCAYLDALRFVKPVVLCGDFNATADDRDIYPENANAGADETGFQQSEREGLLRLLRGGFTDSYRTLHPDDDQAYTWWSSRKNKRPENRGWRLDYFLISDELKEHLVSADILTDVLGSDHCPISLNLDIERPKSVPAKIEASYLDLRDVARVDPYGILGSLSQESLGSMWRSVPWREAEDTVESLQARLAKAAYARDADAIKHLQKRIAFSLEAKLIAVRHVCSSSSGPGVDGIRWIEDHEKMLATLSLTAKGYHASPSRMVVIHSKNGKERRIGIPTCYDRAMQSLYAMTLAPVAEAGADRKSFAFRRGKSMLEMNDYIKSAFSPSRANGMNPPEWAFVCDVRQCYASLSHKWLLDNIPMEKHVLSEFLRAGYAFAGELFPTDSGIGLGMQLSPILANMALDGLQTAIYDALYPDKPDIDYANGNMIRFADDIIITARSREIAESMRGIVSAFLKPRGLELASGKSRVININEGFEFMSRFYQKVDGVMHVYPADGAVARFMGELEDLVDGHTGSQQSLIEKLNRKLSGWATYHKVEESMDAFRKVDAHLKALLLRLCSVKHPKWGIVKIEEHYWYKRADGEYLFALKDRKEVHVRLLKDTVPAYCTRGRLSVNPYIDSEYIADYSARRAVNGASGVYRAIWNRQGGRCFYCGKPILQDQERTIVDAGVGRHGDAYVHVACIEGSIDYVDTDTQPSTATETMELLQALQGRKPVAGQKFLRLGEFFRSCDKPRMSLTFKEIEEKLGRPLGSSQTEKTYWLRTGFMCISQSWLENGYEIEKLDIPNKRITFLRTFQKASNLTIPEVFLTSRIPNEAKYELENYFAYIRKKYGL